MSQPPESDPVLQEMLDMLDKYSDFNDVRASTIVYPRSLDLPGDEGETVLITGTTGRFGAYVLAQLIASRRVRKIYAMNRPNKVSLKRRQIETFQLYDLDVALLDSPKLDLVVCDMTQSLFGLPSDVYYKVSSP